MFVVMMLDDYTSSNLGGYRCSPPFCLLMQPRAVRYERLRRLDEYVMAYTPFLDEA